MWWMPLQNDLDTHIIYMIKKIKIFDNFFQRSVTNLIFINGQKGFFISDK